MARAWSSAVGVSVLLHAGLLYAAVTGRPPQATYEEQALVLEFAAVRGSDTAAPSQTQEAAPPSPPVVKTAARPPAPTTPPSPFAPPAPAAEPAPSQAQAPPQPASAAPAQATRGEASAAATPSAPKTEAAPPRKGVREGMDVDAPHGKGADYLSRLRSWLEAHKTYPKRAKMMRMEGVITVRFAVDRTGRLLSCEIVNGSGYADLDREALAMLHRATPFPAPPHTVKGERIEITTPIEFSLQR